MNSRIIYMISLLAFLCQTISVSAQSLTQRADSAYAADNFAEATELYLQIAGEEGTSSNL